VSGTVLYERDGAVATLTLSRPERLNAIVPELIDDLEAALDRAEADDAIRVVRLRGAGRAFCVGYDAPEGAAFSRAAPEDVRGAVARRDAPFGDYGQEGR
jgi:enoyl-CoA hydratase/carnithine racemase